MCQFVDIVQKSADFDIAYTIKIRKGSIEI